MELNTSSPEAAKARFLDCCHSLRWARKMAETRPFETAAELLDQAEQIWQDLTPADWLEAFAAHPKIGDKKAAPKQRERSAEWSKAEQTGVATAGDSIRDQLAEANRLYEEKFGYIFIVCATGVSAEEMLETCLQRLNNTDDAEILIAADEQRKITEIRLKKLLESGI